jgi:3-oxo-5alpha-steroid 4-dehydrogenase
MKQPSFSCIDVSEVTDWDAETDVIVCGFGGAGGSAALEAARGGAKVILFERASGPGGSTGMSSCEMYLGGSGGTRLQRALGYTDSTENMIAYIMKAFGERADMTKVEAYVNGAKDHFDWVEALGVTYKEAVMLDREVVPLSDESLLFTGNERTLEFIDAAEPVPRGHVPSHEGDFGGKIFIEALAKAVVDAGVDIQYDARVIHLVKEAGTVVGVLTKQDNQVRAVRALRGVVLASGGFIMNEAMRARYIPWVNQWATPYGNPFDMGDGIQLGVAAGGYTINMDEAFLSLPIYPPGKLTFGLMLNQRGHRFVNEDAYLARLAHFSSLQPEQKVYLLLDAEHYDHPMYLERLAVVATGDSIEELAAETQGFPDGALQNTLSEYNRHAESGHDPLFRKAPEWVTPLNKGPFALLDLSFDAQTAVIMPGTRGPLTFSLGGLDTLPTGEVKAWDGDVIPGLYAAGRVTAGLPRSSQGYASGMSVGDATFFGRQAGKRAAARHG